MTHQMPSTIDLALAVVDQLKNTNRPLWVLLGSAQEANALYRLLSRMTDIPGDYLPSLETLPYEALEPHPDVRARRLNCLNTWSSNPGIRYLITSVPAILPYLPPPSFLKGHCFALKCGQPLVQEQFKKTLINSGYLMVHKPEKAGEFSHKGGIIDLYPLGSNRPIRIEWFDDELETIYSLDPKTWNTKERLEGVDYLPAQDYALSDANAVAALKQRWEEAFGALSMTADTLKHLTLGHKVPIADYYLPLLHENVASCFDYFKQGLCLYTQDVEKACNDYLLLCQERFDAMHQLPQHPLLPVERVFLSQAVLQDKLKTYGATCLAPKAMDKAPSIATSLRLKKPFKRLLELLAAHPKNRVVLAIPNEAEQEIMLGLLKEQDLKAKVIEQWPECFKGPPGLFLWVSTLSKGGALEKEHLYLYTQDDLLPKASESQQPEQDLGPSWDLDALSVGDYVVHKKHGIAQFMGIESIHEQDFLTLQFLGDDRLYVPMHALNTVSLYGPAPSKPPINALKSKRWQEKRLKALRKIQDTAIELLQRRAKRALYKRPAYQYSLSDYQAFCKEFPFQATTDQVRVMEEIAGDLAKDVPMDRLVCGDVGFGKTEIMMRTACMAALSGHPVAVLVPTTILAKQHFETFHARFGHWPVHLLSYFGQTSKKEQDKLAKAIANKQIDILIGTHALLTKALPSNLFKMIIVDEEHRFGVKQKEAIKRSTEQLDVLMLSATPIPRSLNMALSSLKDISLLATPPAKRVAVKTEVGTWTRELIEHAVKREILRGGQVFVCYNQVETIAEHCKTLQSWFPELSIDFAHGQMGKDALKKIMGRFYQQSIQILVCTTIIESGIDQPNANTIIVHRADLLGLAQLHQLRGRVGRSHHQAYAYFTYLDEQFITHDAKKRLHALAIHNAIGSGFQLSLQDLEIRGAGDLLGDQQSGHMQAMGLSLYTQTLQKAIKALEANPDLPSLESLLESEQSVEVHHDFVAGLNDHYIPDVQNRLKWYQNIAQCIDPDALLQCKKELARTFGNLNTEAESFLQLQMMRYYAQSCGITSIAIRQNTATCTLDDKASLDMQTLIPYVQKEPERYQLKPPSTLILISPYENTLASLHWLVHTLRSLMKAQD